MFATITPTLPPIASTPTEPPLPAILEIFPLETGLTRVYSATIRQYEVSSNTAQLILISEETDTITETITNLHYTNGKWLFGIVTKSSLSSVRSGTYEVTDEHIYGSSFVDIEIRWPLEVGMEWEERDYQDSQSSFGKPHWHVLQTGDVQTPAGIFGSCYQLEHRRATSVSGFWICPDVGLARADYSLPNSGYNESWELQAIQHK